MTGALVKQGNVVVGPWDREQVNLIKQQIATDLTDGELAVFGQVCQRTGLDPFAKQIYAIKRNGKMTIQTSIDGYRLSAARSNAYAGSDEPAFTEAERSPFPVSAQVTVYRMVAGQRCPFTATARWSEYAADTTQRSGAMWKKMPFTMLGKCAEALALRKAFPAELSGLYTQDEMAQAEPAPAAKVTPEQAAELADLLVQGGTAAPVALRQAQSCPADRFDRWKARAEQLIAERAATQQDDAAEAVDVTPEEDNYWPESTEATA